MTKKMSVILMLVMILALVGLPALAQEPTAKPPAPVDTNGGSVVVVEPAPAADPAVDASVQWVTTLLAGAIGVASILITYFTTKNGGGGAGDVGKELLQELRESRQLLYEAIPPHVFNMVGEMAKEATGILGGAYALTKGVSEVFTPPEGSLTITPPDGSGDIEVSVKVDPPPSNS